MSRASEAVGALRTPALVLYGRNEEIIPKQPIDKALAALPRHPLPGGGRITVAIYENGYHMLMRDLQADIVLNDIVYWIDQPSAPLPSGADQRPVTEVATSR
jgi:alpha-beta hydrolase superfamily lysophospholipase